MDWKLSLREKITKLPRKQRFIIVLLGVALIVGATVPAFLTASCFTHQQTAAERKALESLRAQTRRGQFPPDGVMACAKSGCRCVRH